MNQSGTPPTEQEEVQRGTALDLIFGSLLDLSKRVRWFARKKPLGAVGGLIVLVMGALALLGPLVSPFDPLEIHPDDVLERPQWKYLLGTDGFGRDQLSRLIAASRSALYVSVVSVAIGVTAGSTVGLVSAFRGGWLDLLTQRVVDGILALPILILALATVAVLGPADINVIGALAMVNVPIASRVIRAATLSAKKELYVEAAMAIGASDSRLMFRHIIPAVVAPYLIVLTGQFAWVIIVAAALSFLGVASPPPAPSWGGMLSEGVRNYAERAPWLTIFPGIFISLTVFGFNIVGDAIRDVLDPKLRGR